MTRSARHTLSPHSWMLDLSVTLKKIFKKIHQSGSILSHRMNYREALSVWKFQFLEGFAWVTLSPYKNWKIELGDAPYLRLWHLVHLLISVCSFHWRVSLLSLTKFYRSCHVRDKGLFSILPWVKNSFHWQFQEDCSEKKNACILLYWNRENETRDFFTHITEIEDEPVSV